MNSLTHFIDGEGQIRRKPAKEGKRKKKGKIVPAKGKTSWGRIYADGREVCDLKTNAGQLEYWNRRIAMADRQEWKCGYNCGTSMVLTPGYFESVTFEHVNGRGGGKRDDRIEIDGKPYNLAVCLKCNSIKGSKRI